MTVSPHVRSVWFDFVDVPKEVLTDRRSVWSAFYHWLHTTHGVPFWGAHGVTHVAPDVMNALLKAQRVCLKHNNPGCTKAQLERALSWSDMNAGPLVDKKLRRGTIRCEWEVRMRVVK